AMGGRALLRHARRLLLALRRLVRHRPGRRGDRVHVPSAAPRAGGAADSEPGDLTPRQALRAHHEPHIGRDDGERAGARHRSGEVPPSLRPRAVCRPPRALESPAVRAAAVDHAPAAHGGALRRSRAVLTGPLLPLAALIGVGCVYSGYFSNMLPTAA